MPDPEMKMRKRVKKWAKKRMADWVNYYDLFEECYREFHGERGDFKELWLLSSIISRSYSKNKIILMKGAPDSVYCRSTESFYDVLFETIPWEDEFNEIIRKVQPPMSNDEELRRVHRHWNIHAIARLDIGSAFGDRMHREVFLPSSDVLQSIAEFQSELEVMASAGEEGSLEVEFFNRESNS